MERQALADRAAALRRELGQAAFERGKEAFRAKDWAAAAAEFSRSLTMEPSESGRIEASFRLGAALVRQRKYEPAIAPLKTFLEKDRGSKNREVAMSLLAQAYEQTGKGEQAATVAREISPAKQALPGAERGRASHHARAPPRGAARHAGVDCCAGPGHRRRRARCPSRRGHGGHAPAPDVQDRRRVLRRSLAPRGRRRTGAAALRRTSSKESRMYPQEVLTQSHLERRPGLLRRIARVFFRSELERGRVARARPRPVG